LAINLKNLAYTGYSPNLFRLKTIHTCLAALILCPNGLGWVFSVHENDFKGRLFFAATTPLATL
jgi:hypothetical protein